MLHMLDTDTASYVIKGRSPLMEEKLTGMLPSMVCVSVMTRAELLYGLKRLPLDHRLHIGVRRSPLADEQDLDEAYRAAADAQPKWAAQLPGERAATLRRAAEIMEARREEIVTWLIRESGSTPLKANVEWDSAHAITLEAASAPYRVQGRILPSDIPGKEHRVYRQPVGVVGVISPWNFPLHLTNRSVAPALAVGNTVVIKPASDTPVTGGLLLATDPDSWSLLRREVFTL